MPLARALDRLQCGVIVTPCSLQPTFVNRYAREVLERREALALSNGSLRTHAADDQRVLIDLVTQAATCRLDRVMTIWVRSSDSARRVALHVVGVQEISAQSQALLFICDPAYTVVVDQESLRALYGVTRSEAVFAKLLVGGKSVEEAADALCVSIHTARTHLKRILMKTDAGRQSELLRVLLMSSGLVRVDSGEPVEQSD